MKIPEGRGRRRRVDKTRVVQEGDGRPRWGEECHRNLDPFPIRSWRNYSLRNSDPPPHPHSGRRTSRTSARRLTANRSGSAVLSACTRRSFPRSFPTSENRGSSTSRKSVVRARRGPRRSRTTVCRSGRSQSSPARPGLPHGSTRTSTVRNRVSRSRSAISGHVHSETRAASRPSCFFRTSRPRTASSP